jgi:hypothetical protein
MAQWGTHESMALERHLLALDHDRSSVEGASCSAVGGACVRLGVAHGSRLSPLGPSVEASARPNRVRCFADARFHIHPPLT